MTDCQYKKCRHYESNTCKVFDNAHNCFKRGMLNEVFSTKDSMMIIAKGLYSLDMRTKDEDG